MEGIEGGNVLVTGGSSGIGQAIAVEFTVGGLTLYPDPSTPWSSVG